MAKEEIEKRAEKYINMKQKPLTKYDLVAFAKDETVFLSQHILELQKDKGNLIDRVRELEQQNEKMKCCRNCKNEKIEGACGHFTQVGWCKNWKLAD